MKELSMCCPNVLRLAASKSSYSGREGRRPRGARMPRKTARRKASDRLGRSGCWQAQASSPATKSGGSRKAKVRSRPVAGRPRFRLIPVLLLFMPDYILGNTDNTRLERLLPVPANFSEPVFYASYPAIVESFPLRAIGPSTLLAHLNMPAYQKRTFRDALQAVSIARLAEV